MNSLNKNKRKLMYSLYQDNIPEYDENGDPTGGTKKGYSNPVEFKANLSAGKGSAEEQVFGKSIDFTRSISSTDMALPIDEYSRIWYETEPQYKEDGTVDGDSADYIVAAPVATGLNSLMIAIKKRNKNAGG